MLGAVAVLTVGIITALTAAAAFGSPGIAAACVGLSAMGLVMLMIDAREDRRRTAVPAGVPLALHREHQLTAGDELFGEHDVERDLAHEKRVLSRDMLGQAVPFEEGQRY